MNQKQIIKNIAIFFSTVVFFTTVASNTAVEAGNSFSMAGNFLNNRRHARNERRQNVNNQLFTAIHEGNINAVRTLLNTEHANVNAQDNFGKTPIMYAIEYNNIDIFTCLLGYHPNFRTSDNEGLLPIHHAVIAYCTDFNNYGNMAIINALLESRTVRRCINSQDHHGRTPLIIAAEHYKADLMQLLIANGADPNMTDNNNCSALYYVSSTRNERLYNILQDEGRARTNVGESPLIPAIAESNLWAVTRLLESGADVNAVRPLHHDSVLAQAIFRMNPAIPDSVEICRVLLEHGANPNFRGNDDSNTALHALVSNAVMDPRSEPTFLEMCRLLIAYGADRTLTDFNGQTAFELANENTGYENFIPLLQGAD